MADTPDTNGGAPRGGNHWLARKGTIRLLWLVFVIILALAVAADLFVEPDGAFGSDGTIGFAAWFGFASCVVLVLAARLLALFVKRPDDRYDD